MLSRKKKKKTGGKTRGIYRAAVSALIIASLQKNRSMQGLCSALHSLVNERLTFKTILFELITA